MYPDENMFLKVDRALSKLITLLLSNKKEFNHFFKRRSSDIILLKLGNLHQNSKREVHIANEFLVKLRVVKTK